ncbi:MAG TPA: hypothetical protein VN752_01650 [Solirubrobacterales bacterium]|nr:hypothetical protein [Solirubrobacterales bacterium]
MRKSKALALFHIVFGLVVIATYVGMTLARVSDEDLGAVIAVVGCLGAYIVSRIVMHYPPTHRQR